jgi:hypothetical protein
MSYATINQCANDEAFTDRVTAAVAQELSAHGMAPYPQTYLDPFAWEVASAGDVEAAYASALAADHPNPGGDEAVITDAMILSHVQAAWPAVIPGSP